VVASVRPSDKGDGYEEFGPCPNCELGKRTEEKQWWNGYWRGRATRIHRTCACNTRVSTDEEARQWLEMVGKIVGKPIEGKTEEQVEEERESLRETLAEPAPESSHVCPSYNGRTVPWSQQECAACTPAEVL
jgi:hypothetical protein